MRIRAFQIFFLAISICSPAAAAETGTSHTLEFSDVDGNKLSTADGHTTVLVVTNKANSGKANLVGDRIPDFCLGNPAYRMITLVEFDDHTAGVRAFLTSMVRKRLDVEAKKLQARYDANKIERVARNDVHAAVDFNGGVTKPLNEQGPVTFRIFVFGKNGELLKQWDDVPGAEELAGALKK